MTNTNKGSMKLDRRDLERKTLEVPRANRNTRSFIRSRAEFEKTQGYGCMSVEAGAPKHKRMSQEIKFDSGRKEVDGTGVASKVCTHTRDRTHATDDARTEAGGLNPPPVHASVCCKIPKKQIVPVIASSRPHPNVEPSKSFHISAVLRRKAMNEDCIGRRDEFERAQSSGSGACSANPVEGSGSPQIPPGTEVAYCTNAE